MRPEHDKQHIMALILPKPLHQHIFVQMETMNVRLFGNNHRRRWNRPNIVISRPREDVAPRFDSARHRQARLQDFLRERRKLVRRP